MFCPSCGTPNEDTHKFCKKCGKPLPNQPAQQSKISPKQIPIYHKTTAPPGNPVAFSASIGGITSMIGGALIIVGWFMPWSKDFLTSSNGLQVTISGLSSIFLGLSMLQYSSAAILLVMFGIVVTLVFGSIPFLGGLNIKNGFNIFEDKNFSTSKSFLIKALEKLQSRSRAGFILVAVIFLVPLIFSSLIQATMPGLFLLGQVVGKLLQSESGTGIFVSAAGFAIAYAGARYSSSQIGPVNLEDALNTKNDSNSPPKTEALPSLGELEQELIKGINESLTDTEITDKLNIHVATLNMMKLDLFHRFKVKNEEELIALVKERGLIP